eukprot:2888176-Lingulodinium_polyedra.AAC.1
MPSGLGCRASTSTARPRTSTRPRSRSCGWRCAVTSWTSVASAASNCCAGAWCSWKWPLPETLTALTSRDLE